MKFALKTVNWTRRGVAYAVGLQERERERERESESESERMAERKMKTRKMGKKKS